MLPKQDAENSEIETSDCASEIKKWATKCCARAIKSLCGEIKGLHKDIKKGRSSQNKLTQSLINFITS